MGSLLAAVRENEDAARHLARPGDFEPGRGDHVEEVHLASGAAPEGFAGDGAEALARLREVATTAGEEYVLVLTSENEPYETFPMFRSAR
ncbi:hypothetical protein AWI43_16250 [Streptomyces sp. WAC04657]|uniref:hypothetical protein n=1 Tax=Streptomyces sp. WAC04657 TaxID=1779145 RepID=UPI000786A2C1|nr:hypothetical protein [Streptomyces sp. WAC04657]KYG55773.1 hypothetical protein AWI43_16250 [Streptomyces sp. WAC04657]